MVLRVAPSADIGSDLPPVRKVFLSLRDCISRNRLPAGTLIVLSSIAQERDLSVETVSGAVLMLSLGGLVERTAEDEARVLPISEQRLRNAVFLREQSEVEIVRRLARSANGDFLNDLRELILRQKLVGMRGPRDLLRLDARFHRTLAERAGLGTLWPWLEEWKLCIDRVRFTVEGSLAPEEMISQHSGIVDRIIMRDADGAAAATRYHLSGVLRQLPEYRRTHAGQFCD
ncbi:GntR family transcriptional regulator [Yangia mangrovi]|uniref:GntR family transcriptional regulator n=1 Tax=Alloyangia mangrovi TaxID=1779329 RepID=A0A2A3JN56_9RHOB|nr:GntR family transcriptional regulator [Alloyangia mangrovi]MCT4372176.1 GntR family transcriptional regulator [Alloyangia mangrovi]